MTCCTRCNKLLINPRILLHMLCCARLYSLYVFTSVSIRIPTIGYGTFSIIYILLCGLWAAGHVATQSPDDLPSLFHQILSTWLAYFLFHDKYYCHTEWADYRLVSLCREAASYIMEFCQLELNGRSGCMGWEVKWTNPWPKLKKFNVECPNTCSTKIE